MKLQPKGYSLHIGVNFINARAYQKRVEPLNVCSQDAETLASLARLLKYNEVKELINKKATAKNLTHQLKEYANKMVAGDTLFLTFSGHGFYKTDVNFDEKDGMDEGWCLYDRLFFDDELFRLWFDFEEGVRIIVLSDSCYSGTVTKDYFKEAPVPPRESEITLKEPLCTVKLLASSLENEKSLTDSVYSLFTKLVLMTWYNGGMSDDYDTFFMKLCQQMSVEKPPAHFTIGQSNLMFEKSKAFSF